MLAANLISLIFLSYVAITISEVNINNEARKLFQQCELWGNAEMGPKSSHSPSFLLSNQTSKDLPAFMNNSLSDLWTPDCQLKDHGDYISYDEHKVDRERNAIGLIRISSSNISGFRDNFFCEFTGLTALELTNNHLGDVTHLGLQLSYNCAHASCAGQELRKLDLSGNKLPVIKNFSFCQLKSLLILKLVNCQISSIEPSAFHYTKLGTLYLSKNHLKQLPSVMFTETRGLDFELDNNQFESVPQFGAYDGMYSLSLQSNRITSLKNSDFSGFNGFIVNLSSNNISVIEAEAFNDVKKLHSLYLSGNRITTLNSSLANSPVRSLFLNNNNLKDVPWNELTPQLRHLDLNENFIDDVNFLQLRLIYEANDTHFDRLYAIKLSFNRLTALDDVFLPPAVYRFDVTNNRINRTTFSTQYRSLINSEITQLEVFNVTDNNFSVVPQLLPNSHKIKYDFQRNPLQCSYENALRLLEYGIFGNLLKPPCAISIYKARSQYICETGDFSKMPSSQEHDKNNLLECNIGCPSECQCSVTFEFVAVNVDCSNQDIRQVPQHFDPLKRYNRSEITVNLSGTDLHKLNESSFLSYENVTKLFLNSSGIHQIVKRTFHHLKKLRLLNLADNYISNLPERLFEEQEQLEELYLSNNYLVKFDNLFAPVNNLKTLHLHENHLIDFSIEGLNHLKSLKQLTLYGNYFNYKFSLSLPFCEYLKTHRSIVGNASQLYCKRKI